MDKCRSFSLIAGLPIALCVASWVAASPVFADCRTSQAQAALDQSRHPRQPSIIEALADIDVWKTITLGIYRGFPTLRDGLEQAGCEIGDDAYAMLSSRAFPLAHEPSEIDLVVLSVAQLGFASEASRAAIFARAEKLGLQLCPPEVGPLLRLQYPEQPIGEFLTIAMQPLHMANGELDDLTVANGGAGLSLVAGQVLPDQKLSWNVLLVFARRNPIPSVSARQ